jgi:hypothetical protein
LNADYAVWGSITKIGNGVNIYGKLVDIAANNSPVGIFTLSPGMDDVITKIGDFAQRINQFVMGTPPANAAPVPGIAAKAPVYRRQRRRHRLRGHGRRKSLRE